MNAPVTAPLGPDQLVWAALKARAETAGHSCSRDAAGWVTMSRWGRSVTFEDVGTASQWLDRVVAGGAS